MADIRLNLNVSSNGTTAAETRQATALADQLERGTRAATAQARIRQATPVSSGGGPSGVGADDETAGYRQFRGISGTGAQARDFSKQAAGLGGLVHVYATFAANVFALSAAFTKLKEAADVSNMVKGLDQLGAASGRNLNALSKELVKVSDSAISLKDALTATAQASAGGLTEDQLLRLTAVARNASQALGRDMPDALSRLTRGITKIEPELLDELGILVKVEQANINYARSIGKTASSLTDLEKRQAFATEAITQGEKKFKDIELASNPYQKILASVTNLSVAGLELVNKVLSPMVNLLASSPTALSLTLAGIASILLKQAIPALGQWRESLNRSSIAAREASQSINSSFREFQVDNINRSANAIAQRVAGQRQEMEAAVATLRTTAAEGVRSTRSEIARIISQPIQDITEQEIAKIQKAEKSFRTKAENAAAKAASERANQANLAGPINPEKYEAQASAYQRQAEALKRLREQIPEARRETLEFIEAQQRAELELARTQGVLSEASQRQRIADRAERRAARAEILSNVAQNTQVMGVRGAFAALQNDIRNGRAAIEQIGEVGQAGYQAAVAARRPLEGLAATATMVRGSFAIATSAVTTFLNAFAPWVAIISVAVIALTGLIDYLGTNNKQVKEFTESIEYLSSSVNVMSDTIDNINKKPFLEQLSVESIKSRATAIEGLSGSINKTISTLLKADSAASNFDKFIDGWKAMWGGDLRSVATKGLSGAISQSINAATDGPAKAKLLSSIQEILGTTDTSATGITNALDNLTQGEITLKLQELAAASEEFAKSTVKVSDSLTSFSSSVDETNKQVGLLTVGLTLTDPMSKVGSSIVSLSNTIKNALKDPINSISILNKLINEPGKGTFLPPDIFNKLLDMKNVVDSVGQSISDNSKAIDVYNKQLQKLEEARNKSESRKPSAFKNVKSSEDLQNDVAIESTKAAIEVINGNLAQAREKEKALGLELADINKSIFDYGAKVIGLGLKQASEQAALSISKAALSGISGRGASEVQFKLQVQEIEIQKQIVQGSINLAQALFLNTQSLEKLNAKQALSDTEGKLKATGLTDQDRKTLENQRTNILKTIEVIDKTVDIVKTSKNNPKSLLNSAKNEDPAVAQSLFAYTAPLQGGFAKLAGLDAEKTIAKNNEIIGQMKEQTAYAVGQNDLKLKDLDLDQRILENSKQFNTISEEYYTKQSTRLSLEKQSLDNSNEMLKLTGELKVLETQLAQGSATNSAAAQAVADKKLEIVRAEGRAEEANNLIKQTGVDKLNQQILARKDLLAKAEIDAKVTYGQLTPERGQESAAALEREALLRNNASKEELAAFDIRQKSIEYTNQYATATRELGYEIAKVNTLQTKTVSIADSLAKAFGRVGSAIGLVAKATTKSAADRLGIEQKLLEDQKKANDRYGKGSSKAIEQNIKLEKAAAADKTSVNIGMYADIAAAAADAFDQQSGAAKAFHAIEKALHIAKLAMDIESIVSSIAVAGIQETLASSLALSWIPAVWARAFGEGGPYLGWALGAAAVAMIGLNSGGGGGKAPPSSEDLQKVQGTGQRYNEKGELVSTGYGVLGDDTAKSSSIANSLELVAQYAYEELDFSQKMLSTLKDISNSLAGVSKSLVLTKGITSGTAFNTKEGTTGGGLISSIFGGKTSTEITGAGLNIKGTVQSLSELQGIIQQYETIKKTKSGGWFSSSKTSYSTNVTDLSGSIVDSIGMVFANVQTSLLEAGKQLGLSSEELIKNISSIPIDISIELRNLSGEDLEKAVSAVLSSTMDMITEKALSVVKPYQKLGEGLAETAIRVANDSRVIDLQLKSVGMSFGAVGINSLAMREALIEAAGGLEEFVSSSEYFKDNFLTSAQQLAPVQKAVSEELARLGLTNLDSRAKFADLVLSLDLSTKSGQELYTSLMALQKGFALVYEETEDLTLSTKELASSLSNQLIDILNLTGKKVAATNLSRELELKSMDKRLIANQLYIYALEDEQTARDALQEAYDRESQARKESIDTLKQSRDTLINYAKTLALGTTSPLTPQQKYEQAKADLAGITKVINDSVSTKEDKAAAINKLPEAISNFLETSKVFNASSEAYQQDYAYSQKLLLDNSTKLSDQISIEQQQLDNIKKQVASLGIIEENTLTIGEGVKNLLEAINKSQALQQGTDKGQDFGNYAFVKNAFSSNAALSGTSDSTVDYFANRISSGSDTRDSFMNSIGNIIKITGWYNKVLNRQPELAGLQFWLNQFNIPGMTELAIKQGFAYGASRELGTGILPDINSFAKGGFASGLSIVGEEGPEFVDFTNPGRVYSKGQSESLFSEFGGNMAQELRALREEVINLRKDSKTNSDNQIRGNAMCSENSANVIAEAITESSSKVEFNRRNTAEFN